jgi:zinc transport system permease protein
MIEIFSYGFMQRALIAGLVISLMAPVIGTYLVVRRYSLMADTLAHVSLVGVALGLILGIEPIIAATVVAGGAALGVEELRSRRGLFGESVLALFLSGSLALAVILIHQARGFGLDLFSFLFGSITTVSLVDVWTIGIVGGIVWLLAFVMRRQLFVAAFDTELAQAGGIPVRLVNGLLVVLAALAVALSMRVVGVLLVGALMVIPVLVALQFQRGFRQTMVIGVGASVVSVITGLVVSFYADTPSGATIVLCLIGLFIITLFGRRALERFSS